LIVVNFALIKFALINVDLINVGLINVGLINVGLLKIGVDILSRILRLKVEDRQDAPLHGKVNLTIRCIIFNNNINTINNFINQF